MFETEYEEVVTAIENKRRFGNLKGVEITAKMLDLVGHPEQSFPVIHIAGTRIRLCFFAYHFTEKRL